LGMRLPSWPSIGLLQNEDDERTSEPGEGILPSAGPSAGAVHAQVQVPVQGPVQGVSAGGNEETAQGGAQVVSIEKQMRGPVFSRWRLRFHDIRDERFGQIVRDYQG
jgi:hypothetical protein